ncbi:hypothetical protein [Clostridium novyi]
MNKNKIRKLFAVAVISGALMTGLKSEAYAVVTDYAIKVNDQVYSYNQNNLISSFLDYKINKPAKLYEDFKSKLKAGNGFYAFKDDKKGFIPYETLEKGFLEAKYSKKTFNIDKIIEMDDCKAIEVNSVKEIKINEKNEISEVLTKKEDENKDNKNDNKAKSEETVTSKSTTSSSKSSGGSSSRRSSSSKRREEPKKEVVNQEPKKEEVQKKPEVVKDKKQKKEEAVNQEPKKEVVNQEPKKEEIQKKPEVVKDKEEKKLEEKNKREEVFPQIAQGKRGEVKENEKPQPITSGKNVKLKSEITQVSQKQYTPVYQVTTVFIMGTVENDGTIDVAGEKVEVKKGDDYSKVAQKIRDKFKNNEDWNVESKYVQSGYKYNLTFTSKKIKNHVDNLFTSGNGIEFANVINEQYGFKGISPKQEVCTVTVLNDSTEKQILNIKVYGEAVNREFCAISVELESNDTKEKIAEKIAAKLKQNSEINRLFTSVENNGDKVILKQRQVDKMNLKVTIEDSSKKQEKIASESVVKSQVNDDEQRQLQEQKDKKTEEEREKSALKKQQEDSEVLKKEQTEQVQNEEIKIVSKQIKEGTTGEKGTNQTGTLGFIFKGTAKDKLTKNQKAEILDKTIEFESGDDSSKIKSKILKAFEGHQDWKFEVNYVVSEAQGARVKYTCNKIQEDVPSEEFAKDTDEIKFMISNDMSGSIGKPEQKEELEIVVEKLANKNATLDITLSVATNKSNLGNVKVQIKEKDNLEDVAKKIEEALKANTRISRLYAIKAEGSKVTLIQNIASKDQTDITIKIS